MKAEIRNPKAEGEQNNRREANSLAWPKSEIRKGPGAHGAFDPSWLTCDAPGPAPLPSQPLSRVVELQGSGGVLQGTGGEGRDFLKL